MDAEFKVEGLAELRAALLELPRNIGRNVLRGAVNAGAREIAEEVKVRAPIDTGRLRAAVFRKHARELSSAMRQTFIVGVRSGKRHQQLTRGRRTVNLDAFYWRFVEFGTSKMSARPFIRPAFDVKKFRAVEAIKGYLARRIPLEAAKLRGRR